MGFFDFILGSKYKSNLKNRVPERQMAALNVGAINAEQTESYCDSLSTGLKLKSLVGNLASAYDILDRDSALDTLDWLKNRGHRHYFVAVKGLVAGKTNAIDESVLLSEELPNTYEYINHMNSTIAKLTEEGFIQDKADLAKISILAWDMGRLVFVARCCQEVNFITENEAWDYINDAYGQCKEVYSSWEELGKGYIIGRCMWSGESMSLGVLMGICKDLIKDAKSPWNLYKFK